MKKKIKRKLKIKIFPLMCAIIIVFILYFAIMFFLDMPIKNIYILGNNILTDQEIIELGELEDYPSFLKTSSKKLQKKIENNAYISKATIKKVLFNQIKIEVEENNPLFIDKDGMLILSNGEKISNDKNIEIGSLINYIPDTKYNDLIEKIGEIDINILAKISEIKYEPTEQDKDRFGLYMNDGNLVYLTLTKFYMLNYYNSVLPELGCKKGILNLDSGNHFEIKIDCE